MWEGLPEGLGSYSSTVSKYLVEMWRHNAFAWRSTFDSLVWYFWLREAVTRIIVVERLLTNQCRWSHPLLNAAHEDAGTFNVFLTSDVSCGYGDGWGDVNVLVNLHGFLHTTSITLLGLGMGMGGVILNLVLTCTLSAHYVDHVAWVCYGVGCGDVKFRVNLHAFCTLRRSRCLGWVWGWVGWY